MASNENDPKQLPDKELKKNMIIIMVKDKEIKEIKLIQDMKAKWHFKENLSWNIAGNEKLNKSIKSCF